MSLLLRAVFYLFIHFTHCNLMAILVVCLICHFYEMFCH